jgi:uncharacterized protein (DUF1810 family)
MMNKADGTQSEQIFADSESVKIVSSMVLFLNPESRLLTPYFAPSTQRKPQR